MNIQVEDLGINVPIRAVLEKQDDYWAERVYKDVPDKIIFVEHMPVYTAGASLAYGFSNEKIAGHFKCSLNKLRCPIEYTRRGGLVTYQGPGILSVYCIFKINSFSFTEFADALIFSADKILKEYGISTNRKCKNPGIYIGSRKKIVSYGVQVSRGVTRYGIAISLDPEQSYIEKMIPCGLKNMRLTSLRDALQREITAREKSDIKFELSEQIIKKTRG